MLGTQLKERHLLFSVSFVFTLDSSGEYNTMAYTVALGFVGMLIMRRLKMTGAQAKAVFPHLIFHYYTVCKAKGKAW